MLFYTISMGVTIPHPKLTIILGQQPYNIKNQLKNHVILYYING